MEILQEQNELKTLIHAKHEMFSSAMRKHIAFALAELNGTAKHITFRDVLDKLKVKLTLEKFIQELAELKAELSDMGIQLITVNVRDPIKTKIYLRITGGDGIDDEDDELPDHECAIDFDEIRRIQRITSREAREENALDKYREQLKFERGRLRQVEIRTTRKLSGIADDIAETIKRAIQARVCPPIQGIKIAFSIERGKGKIDAAVATNVAAAIPDNYRFLFARIIAEILHMNLDNIEVQIISLPEDEEFFLHEESGSPRRS